MAVYLESGTSISRWRGLSSDPKPQFADVDDSTPIREMSVFRELDTGRQFIWTDDQGWVRQNQSVETLLMDVVERLDISIELQQQAMRGWSAFTEIDFFDC